MKKQVKDTNNTKKAKCKICWVDPEGKTYFETITENNFRKVLDEVCAKAKRAGLYGHAKSVFYK